MKTRTPNLIVALALLALSTIYSQLSPAFAQGTAFTYQGRLNDGGSPANGSYDFRFRLAIDSLGNTYIGAAYLTNGVAVSNGLFTTTTDFGPGLFAGSNLWLEVDVRTNNGGSYTVLDPLQALTPAPYAIMANSASNLLGTLSTAQLSGTFPANQLSGTLLNSSLPASPTFSGAVTANSLSGNGANVTNVNAAALSGLGAGSFWQLGGNSVAPGQFLGSTNNQPLALQVNGQRALLLVPDNSGNNAPILVGGYQGNSADASSYGAVIAGGAYNGIQTNSYESSIGGGYANTVEANVGWAFIGGGYNNTIQPGGGLSVLGGGQNNVIASNQTFSVIGGGYQNELLPGSYGFTHSSVIAGGAFNQLLGPYSFVGGGVNNREGVPAPVLGGGFYSTTNGWNTIGGGSANAIGLDALGGFIGSGFGNVIQTNAQNAVIAGGYQNVAAGTNVALGGGAQNTASGNHATVPGGFNNLASGTYSLAAGYDAQSTNDGAFVWADAEGAAFASTSTNQFNVRADGGVRFVTGGTGMTLDGQPVLAGTISLAQLPGVLLTNNEANVILGGTFSGNGSGLTSLNASQLGSGVVPWAQLPAAIVTNNEANVTLSGTFSGNGGGLTNLNASQLTSGTVSSGLLQGFQGAYNASGGGQNNSANGSDETVSGGLDNTILGDFTQWSTIGGGYANTNSGSSATIAGGYENYASGPGAVVGGGDNNTASGTGAMVGGGAQSIASGANATVPGGYQNVASGNLSFAAGYNAHATNNGAFVWSDDTGTFTASTAANQFIVRASGGFIFYSSTAGGVGAQLPAGSGSWSSLSDRNAKDDFTPVNPETVLARVASLPMSTWSYKTEPGVRHVGPMAQDFYAAFKVGEDNRHIGDVDEGGVALAAIQGLNQKLESEAKEKDAEIQELKQRLEALEKIVLKQK